MCVCGGGAGVLEVKILNFFKNCILAHLSRRLTGELIVYPCSGIRPSVVHISKTFSSETARP